MFPELKGKLNGHAIRVPMLNASITDLVFVLKTPTTVRAARHASPPRPRPARPRPGRPIMPPPQWTKPCGGADPGGAKLG